MLQIVFTALVVLALVIPFVALVVHRRPHDPYDPWFPAGHGNFHDGEPDPSVRAR